MESPVEEFIRAAVQGPVNQARYLGWYSEATLGAFCNDVALVIARRFLDDEMSFDDADAVANQFYALYIGQPIEIPEPADSIYLAFDRGEFAIDGEDPVEEHTRPALRSIMESLKSRI
ncbi:MAG: hypothetical protein ACR2QZ_00320 [Woeseiaceae bacterium]